MFDIPIVFIIFNRPKITKQVFDAIKKIKPNHLLIVGDGPRRGNTEDILKCKATRSVVENIDWDCKVLKNYSDVNMGCGMRVSSGIDWAFKLVDKAIILEDDCLPHPDFFLLCKELLNRYEDDEKIYAISGTNLYNYRTRDSYFFSSFAEVWGFATWRRAWKFYDFKISQWPDLKVADFLSNIFNSKKELLYWQNLFDQVYNGEIDTWDYQWLFTLWLRKGLNIIPQNNLISNVGFSSSTHNLSNTRFSNLPVKGIGFPLKHPDNIIKEKKFDEFYQRYFTPNFFDKLMRKLSLLKRNLNQ